METQKIIEQQLMSPARAEKLSKPPVVSGDGGKYPCACQYTAMIGRGVPIELTEDGWIDGGPNSKNPDGRNRVTDGGFRLEYDSLFGFSY